MIALILICIVIMVGIICCTCIKYQKIKLEEIRLKYLYKEEKE